MRAGAAARVAVGITGKGSVVVTTGVGGGNGVSVGLGGRVGGGGTVGRTSPRVGVEVADA